MRDTIAPAVRIGMLLVALAAAPAVAQDSSDVSVPATDSAASDLPDDVQSFAGDWVLQQEDANAATCALTFTDQPAAGGGWAVTLPDACPAPFPDAAALAVWSVDDSDGSILIGDASQHTTLKLIANPDGFYATDEDVSPRFYLVSPNDEDGAGGEQDSD